MDTAYRILVSSFPSIYTIVSHFLHATFIMLLMFSFIVIWKVQQFFQAEEQYHTSQNDVEKYGYMGFMFLYFIKLTPCLSIPFTLMNTIALTFTNLWPDPPKLEVQKSDIPNICFRIVTRGLYRNLVINCLERNIETVLKTGLERFTFEVITDIPLCIQSSMFVHEIVVPENYTTKNNSQFKARALHYCLENGTSNLSDHDWIVHLDEETLLTQESVIGVANFTAKALGDIGQGVITYANTEIVNWWTTLADSIRVGLDIGLMKFCFQKLHRPIYGLKGSYIVIKVSTEKHIGFDFGPKGSIAEDLYFALEAWKNGSQFNFVEGEMWEKSPFTIFDYIRQRKRWFIGRMYTLLSSNIPLKYKLFLLPADLSWVFLLFSVLTTFLPVMVPNYIIVINSWIGGSIVYLFIIGTIHSFSVKRYGICKKLFLCLWTIFIIPLAACLDGIASLYGICNTNERFYIVQKEQKTCVSHMQGITPTL